METGCNSHKRKIIVLDSCPLALIALQNLVEKDCCAHVVPLLMEPADVIRDSANLTGVDEFFFYLNCRDYSFLYVIQAVMKLKKYARVIAMLEDGDYPSLQLVRGMGVTVILSRRESVMNIIDVMRCPEINNYISEKLLLQSHAKYFREPVIQHDLNCNPHEVLTTSEITTLIDLLNGDPAWLVAERYSLSAKTISTFKLNALNKMGLKSLNAFFLHRNQLFMREERLIKWGGSSLVPGYR